MSRTYFFEDISEYVAKTWEMAVHEAEEAYSRDDIGSPYHVFKIREYAQLQIISGLVKLKGEWLTVGELQYALDQFAKHSSSVDYFRILKYKGAGVNVLSEFREFVAMQDAM